MAGDDPIKGCEQFHTGWVHTAVAKPPTAMVFQFGPAFVGVVVWQPEGAGVGDVDGDGHAKFSASLPDGIELGVIDLDQVSLAVFEKQPEPLELLQTCSTLGVARLNLLDSFVAPARPVPVAVVQEH